MQGWQEEYEKQYFNNIRKNYTLKMWNKPGNYDQHVDRDNKM